MLKMPNSGCMRIAPLSAVEWSGRELLMRLQAPLQSPMLFTSREAASPVILVGYG